MDNVKKQCLTCKHVKLNNLVVEYLKRNKNNIDEEVIQQIPYFGECRKNPPNKDGMHKQIHYTTWCSQYKPVEFTGIVVVDDDTCRGCALASQPMTEHDGCVLNHYVNDVKKIPSKVTGSFDDIARARCVCTCSGISLYSDEHDVGLPNVYWAKVKNNVINTLINRGLRVDDSGWVGPVQE